MKTAVLIILAMAIATTTARTFCNISYPDWQSSSACNGRKTMRVGRLIKCCANLNLKPVHLNIGWRKYCVCQ
ncbi:hypothetical protein RRG08_066074 [Elysia crispata]|uniref:Uncharacterized protein n=1 Tax=Elysia crispata TaxID=231223 RepID=A0AAE0ZG43_9GAST|nr:hypothetical protein RRG08_066074 [Elysia crispata]